MTDQERIRRAVEDDELTWSTGPLLAKEIVRLRAENAGLRDERDKLLAAIVELGEETPGFSPGDRYHNGSCPMPRTDQRTLPPSTVGRNIR